MNKVPGRFATIEFAPSSAQSAAWTTPTYVTGAAKYVSAVT